MSDKWGYRDAEFPETGRYEIAANERVMTLVAKTTRFDSETARINQNGLVTARYDPKKVPGHSHLGTRFAVGYADELNVDIENGWC